MSAERDFAPRRAPRVARPRGTALRLLPGIPRTGRAPFVVLVLGILGIGLIGLLLLNTSLQQRSFELEELRRETTQLRDEHASLSKQVSTERAPEQLARRADQLGMVPVEEPEYVKVDRSGSP